MIIFIEKWLCTSYKKLKAFRICFECKHNVNDSLRFRKINCFRMKTSNVNDARFINRKCFVFVLIIFISNSIKSFMFCIFFVFKYCKICWYQKFFIHFCHFDQSFSYFAFFVIELFKWKENESLNVLSIAKLSVVFAINAIKIKFFDFALYDEYFISLKRSSTTTRFFSST